MIALYNLEPKYTNIALEKIRMYYGLQGEIVEDYLPLLHDQYDKIYCSSIFDFTDKRNIPDDIICGGSGFNLTTVLPKEIEAMKPKINMGFTTRGCIRKCSFCIVPEKEGKIKAVGDIYDFWDGESKNIDLLDNNPTALSEHFEKICYQIWVQALTVNIHGIDIRIMTDRVAYLLSTLRHSKQIRFAWDSMKDKKSVLKGISTLRRYFNPYQLMCYVLIGFNTTEDEDWYRIQKLRRLRIDPFVMPYNKYDQYQKRFARWVNHKAIFRTVKWSDYK